MQNTHARTHTRAEGVMWVAQHAVCQPEECPPLPRGEDGSTLHPTVLGQRGQGLEEGQDAEVLREAAGRLRSITEAAQLQGAGVRCGDQQLRIDRGVPWHKTVHVAAAHSATVPFHTAST